MQRKKFSNKVWIVVISAIILIVPQLLMAQSTYSAGSQTDERPPQAPSALLGPCLLYTSPSPRDGLLSRMPSSA